MPYSITTIAVIGSGYMGGGIAQVFARAGFSVLIADQSAEVAAKAHHRLVEEAQQFEDRGLFPDGSAAAITQNLSAAESVEDAAATADLVIEAVFEDVDVKTAVLQQISAAARAETIIGTNTSTMSVNTLKPAVSAPRAVHEHPLLQPRPLHPGRRARRPATRRAMPWSRPSSMC